ncbi:MAG TPA: glutathione S-transferase [Oceanospirillales bacterium]|nr:glutathione S-transferase [Oceanospirillales bacterium]
MNKPILYSLQHCPYAMRARMGLLMAKQQVMLRAITMKNKPEEMLKISPKGTVPVLVLTDETLSNTVVIDESLDIMVWALQQNDPEDLLHKDNPEDLLEMLELVKRNDKEFKPQLEIYKKSKRFRTGTEVEERQKCEVFIAELEQRLSRRNLEEKCFVGNKQGLIDYALIPFVRQFSRVNKAWFKQAPYPLLREWIQQQMQTRLYAKAMEKYPLWLDEYEECLFGDD